MFVLRDACLPGFAADNRAGGHAPPDRLQAAHELADASGNTYNMDTQSVSIGAGDQ